MNLKRANWGYLLVLAGIMLGTTGCATPRDGRDIALLRSAMQSSNRDEYRQRLAQSGSANSVLPQRMPPSAARSFLKGLDLTSQHVSVTSTDDFRREHRDIAITVAKSLAQGPLFRVGTILLTQKEIVFVSIDNRGMYTARISSLENVSYAEPFLDIAGLRLKYNSDEYQLYIPDPLCGRQLANAISSLKETTPEEALQEEASFEQALQSFLNAAAKPEFTEDVRRFKIQAENAVREKRYGDAVNLYEKALNIAPWWADGHYNRAMVFSELQVYETAILEMRRYLKLATKAAIARSAQDKIYEWEAKVK